MAFEHATVQMALNLKGPPIGGGSVKRNVTHPTATVVYNTIGPITCAENVNALLLTATTM